jgi:Fe-S-cluster containining protein
LSCGACCFSELSNYVRVTGDDYARLGEDAETLAFFDGTRAYMKMESGHCAALCVGGGDELCCSIYEKRPQICRDLARGSGECLAEREAKAERPRLLLLRTRPVSTV